LNIYSSCLLANTTNTPTNTRTNKGQLSKENILRLKKRKGKETKESRKYFLSTNHHKQTHKAHLTLCPAKLDIIILQGMA